MDEKNIYICIHTYNKRGNHYTNELMKAKQTIIQRDQRGRIEVKKRDTNSQFLCLKFIDLFHSAININYQKANRNSTTMLITCCFLSSTV